MLQLPVAADRRRFVLCLSFSLDRRRMKQHSRATLIINEAPTKTAEKGKNSHIKNEYMFSLRVEYRCLK